MEALLKRLLDFTGDGVYRYTFDEGRILFCNQGFVNIYELDCPPEEVVGKCWREIIIYLEEEGARRRALREKGETHGFLYHLKTLKGTEKWVVHDQFLAEDRVTHKPVVEGIVKDVTATKRAEEALEHERNLLRTLIDNLPDPIYFKDTESRFVIANTAVARVMGAATPDDLLGKTDFDFYPGELAQRYYDDERLVIQTAQPLLNREEPAVDPSGAARWFSTTKAPITDSEGHVIGVVGIGREITQHRKAEEALRLDESRLEALLKLDQIAQASLQEIGTFAMEEGVRLTASKVGYLAFLNEEETVLTMYAWSKVAMEECQITDKPLIYPVETTGLLGEAVRQRQPVITNDYAAPNPRKKGYPEGHVALTRHMNVPVFDREHIVLVAGVGNKETDYDESDVRQLTLLMTGFWRIVQRRQAETALRESEEKYHALFEAFPVGIFLGTPDGRVRDCNPHACETYGYTKAELIGLTVNDLFPEEVAARDPNVIVEEMARSGAFTEVLGKRKNGEIFPVELTARFITIGGERLVVIRVHDTTDRKRAEDERRQLETRIQQTQKLESLGVLAGGIAHDFNNLLTGILGHASLALMEMSPVAPGRESVTQIEITARRAAELTRQMLAYSGRGKFALQSIRLSEVVEEMTHLLEVSISKKCALKFCFPHKLPYIEGDVTQVRQVIMNLIINASEAIGDQSGVITVSTGVVDCDHAYLSETYLVDDLPPGTYVYLEVADTGCGMTPEVRSRIFDPFFTTKFTGRGLGLAAVLGIIRGHRGAIKVYSEVGRGTTFKALFPVPKQEGTSAAKAAAAPEVWHGTGTILVIDDERVVRELAKEVLGKIGFTVLTASDGREGLEVFRARVNEICLVLLDLTMPHMDGEETFRDLRRGRSDVRVILSSGYNEQDATQRFTGKGLAGFIHKPYRAEDLTEAVRKALEPGPEASGQGSPRKNGGTHQDSHP